MSDEVVATLAAIGIVPVVTIDGEGGDRLAHALTDGGIGCAEITLRTPAGLAAIAAASRVPGFTVGAGTVLSVDDVDRSVDAGARFVVSPGFDDDVVAHALELGIAVIPGVSTATEVQRARRAGLSHLKFFPAEAAGGLAAISALAAPFPDVRFLPSGGVSPRNARDYLASPAVFAVSGSWMVPRDRLLQRDFAAVTALSHEAVAGIGRAG